MPPAKTTPPEAPAESKASRAEGEITIKKALIGIALILFAILFQLCCTGMELATLGVGLLGLILTVFAALKHE